MMNMMYTTGFHSGAGLIFSLHVLGMITFLTGVLFLVIWAVKNFSAAKLWSLGLWLAIGGAIVCLLTLMMMPAIRVTSFNGETSGRLGGMMNPNWNLTQTSEPAVKDPAQVQEEADGKALYDKLQAKQTTCGDLSDKDFELIGEYMMGLRAGAAHEQMNTMIKQMNGGDDAQVHILLAKNVTGCGETGSGTTQGFGGMMNGGAMMRQFQSSASSQK